MGYRTMKYRMKDGVLEDRIFDTEVESIPEGWYHDPFAAMNGDTQEVKIEPAVLADLMEPETLQVEHNEVPPKEVLELRYKKAFGRLPHHKMKPETIQKKLDELETVSGVS